MISVINAFRWTVEIAWLYMMGDLAGCECNVFRRLVYDKVDKNHHLDWIWRQDNLQFSSYTLYYM